MYVYGANRQDTDEEEQEAEEEEEENMAAPMALRKELLSVTRILRGNLYLSSRSFTVCSSSRKCSINRCYIPPRNCFHSAASLLSNQSSVTVTEEPDTLFQKITVKVKGHDKAVLDSYEFFTTMAAKELGITISKVFEPPKDIERLTLLKSVHIFKKHRVQYEMRTHYRCIELFHMTGSTARVYLEYIQRNLPEGVAMEVTKTSMEKVPNHILEPMWTDISTEDTPNQ
ncbi:small ribosomal subunit protein uS10m isoform X2 [Gouania willdenowi]|uniref:small ribosomal subunit protein uS10m isoform X2 n=1 Tax=Gouania willdenowi TaxID=441366 RepID=UPI00105676E0|nr:28S ribosomal protein S10, mitochondrial isoform X2 [Gouania willdenowi]